MGCDIHCYAEIKYKGRWRYAGEIDVDRDYWLFAKMANVRNYDNEIEPISEPKGRPKNIDELTNFLMDDCGCCDHSDSWLSANEIKVLYEWTEERQQRLSDTKLKRYLSSVSPFSLIIRNDPFPDNIEDVRLIFSFDN